MEVGGARLELECIISCVWMEVGGARIECIFIRKMASLLSSAVRGFSSSLLARSLSTTSATQSKVALVSRSSYLTRL